MFELIQLLYRFDDHVADFSEQHNNATRVVVEGRARPDETHTVHDSLVVALRLVVFGVDELVEKILHRLHVQVDVVRFSQA